MRKRAEPSSKRENRVVKDFYERLLGLTRSFVQNTTYDCVKVTGAVHMESYVQFGW